MQHRPLALPAPQPAELISICLHLLAYRLLCLNICISRQGTLYTWGAGKEGQLGLGVKATGSRMPRVVGELESEVIVTVSCGSDHTAAVAMDGAYASVSACASHARTRDLILPTLPQNLLPKSRPLAISLPPCLLT